MAARHIKTSSSPSADQTPEDLHDSTDLIVVDLEGAQADDVEPSEPDLPHIAVQSYELDSPPSLFEDSGFGAEFRQLARQRRFERSVESEARLAGLDQPVSPPARAEDVEPRRAEPEAAIPSGDDIGLPAIQALLASARRAARLSSVAQSSLNKNVSAPTSQTQPAPLAPPQVVAPAPAPPQIPAPVAAARTTTDPNAALVELARLADRVVDARENLVIERARADRAESEVSTLRDRLFAARELVHDAQRATAEASERAAWLEGHCTALEDSLDKALSSSFLHRWRWRRSLRARSDG